MSDKFLLLFVNVYTVSDNRAQQHKSLKETTLFDMIMVGSSQGEGQTTASRVIIAIVLALGLMGAVVVTIFIIQEAEARGCRTGIAVNASKGRCLQP